jgi:hypothetical protein
MRICLLILIVLYGILFVSLTIQEKEQSATNIQVHSSHALSSSTGKGVPSAKNSAKTIMYDNSLLYHSFYDNDDDKGIWTNSTIIPNWMKEYFDWHEHQRQQILTPTKYTEMNYLIMQCTFNHAICGGTSDRLKGIPTLLRYAARTNRFLLIHWERPWPLEEFLLPPKGMLL